MRVKKMKFKDSGKELIPTAITVTLSLAEAVCITKILGKVKDGDPIVHEIYSCLECVFNHLFEDGVDEASKEMRGE